MNDADGERGSTEGAPPQEIPEHVFRKSDDWKFLKAARRERRRQEWTARRARLLAALREHQTSLLAAAAPIVALGLAWMIGAVRW